MKRVFTWIVAAIIAIPIAVLRTSPVISSPSEPLGRATRARASASRSWGIWSSSPAARSSAFCA